jgi:hypothetical protein
MNAMRRSSRWRTRRRSDSRSTAPDTEPATTNLIAVPDGARPLSEGLVVEASVVARLFRIRLLAVDANLVVTPAHVQRRTPAAMPRTRRPPIGAGLVAAERFIDEGAASLAASRAIGTTAARPGRRA